VEKALEKVTVYNLDVEKFLDSIDKIKNVINKND
jgi:hypothetical protein